MIGFTLDKAKANFFNTQAVLDAASKAERQNLSRFGAFVRTTARQSIKVRQGTSSPGGPPHGHTSGTRTKTNKKTGQSKRQPVSLLREYLYFAFDPDARSVVVGPVKLGGKIGDAPAALEYGGASERLTTDRQGNRVVERTMIEERPFMRPAFAANLPRAGKLWRDSIK